MHEIRKLSTILFADIAGYTALMQSDERQALDYLNHFKTILERETPANQGSLIQYFGDGCLLAFDSSWHGLKCAMAIQQAFIAKDIPVRVGIHLGDVVFKEENVFGDGVNIASRIETLGVPGSVLMSYTIRDQIINKPEFSLTSLGSFEFKNVVEPVEVFALANPGFVIPDKRKMTGKLKQVQPWVTWYKWAIPAAIVLLALVFMWYQNYQNESEEIISAVPKLAVLDFKNEGQSLDHYFASGITQELNSQLTGLRKLAVISRMSAAVYMDSNKTPQEIGKELEVDYILEGNVQWSNQQSGKPTVVITPNLVRVADNTSIWSTQLTSIYDQTQNVQSEITRLLLQKLNVVISVEEQKLLETSLTDNHLAYQAYLKGLRAKPPGHGAETDFRTAFKMFQQAVALDPGFTLAWLGLSYVYRDLYWFGYESHPSTLDSALVCMEKAKKLQPNHPQVTIGMGDYYYRLRDYDKAMQEFAKVMDERPNDSDLLQRIGEVWRRQGLFTEALETLEKGLILDPFNVNSLTELSWTYIFVGDFERAFELQDQARIFDPDGEWNYLIRALIHWSRGEHNDLQEARLLLENVPDPQSYYPAWFWITQSWFENDPEAVLRLVKNISVSAIELQHIYEPRELIAGLAYRHLGQHQQAKKEFAVAAKILEEEVAQNPSDFRMHMALGLAYAGLGKKQEAITSGKEGPNLLPLENDSLLGLDVLYGLMRIYAILKEDELALNVMSKLLSVNCHYRGLFFTANPEFAGLQQNPRFLDLVEKQNRMKQKFKN